MRKFIWIVGFILLSTTAEAKSIPDWFTTPPNDSVESFYSVGSGQTIEEAKTDALVTLSTRLIVNIASEQESQVEKQDDEVSMRLISNTVQTTEELAFFKVDVLKQVNAEKQTFVLVSASKKQVFDAIRDKLDTTISPLLQVNATDATTSISQALQFYTLWPTYSKYYRLLQSYQQPTQRFSASLNVFRNEIKTIQNDTGFQVVTGSNKHFGLANSIDDQLQQLGFTKTDKRHHLQATVVGPELKSGTTARDLAYQATGKIVYTMNGAVVFETPISAFAFGSDKSVVWQQLYNDVTKQVLFGSHK